MVGRISLVCHRPGSVLFTLSEDGREIELRLANKIPCCLFILMLQGCNHDALTEETSLL